MTTSAKRLTLLYLFFIGAILGGATLSAQEYDLVITNGRVIDPETEYDAVANVGIKGGQIAVITRDKITAKETIDASGHVVSFGFIDLHAHGQNIGDYRMQAMQGVTTMLELESGVLPIADWYETQLSFRNAPKILVGDADNIGASRSVPTPGAIQKLSQVHFARF